MKSASNHYIPRFLLSYFAAPDGLLWGHDIEFGSNRRKGPKGFAFEHELYRATAGDEDLLEAAFADMESRLSVVIARALKDGTIQFLTREQMQAMCAFVANQAGRLPHVRDQVRAAAGAGASRKEVQKRFIAEMWKYFMDGGPILSFSQARLLATHTSAFVLGDRPVLADKPWSVLKIPNPLPRVWMPLSPSYAIEFIDPTVKLPAGRKMPNPLDERSRWPVVQATHALTDEEVDAMNAKQVSAARKRVFSRDALPRTWVLARRKAGFHLLSTK